MLKMLGTLSFKPFIFGPCLARWDSRYHFYIQTDFCIKSMDFVGMQLAQDAISMSAMRQEMEGCKYEFLTDPPTNGAARNIPCLKLVCFGSRKCKGYKIKLPSYLGKAFAGNWGLGKCHHYL